jgi:hypothetical protein
MGEELTIEELGDIKVILVRFMADKEAHKKIPCLESRAPKLWNKIDHMYKCKQKRNGNNRQSYGDQSHYFS